jgi:ketosteroid isomerase-like protein
MSAHASSRDVVARFLAASVSDVRGDLADLYAEEVTVEMPFGPPLHPAMTKTDREALRTRFEAGASMFRFTSVKDVVIHETRDPEVVIAEYTMHGETATEPRRTFAMPLLMVLTIRDELIVHTRDYNSAVAAAQALGTVPQLIGALEGLSSN